MTINLLKLAKRVEAWQRMNFPRSFYIPKNAPNLKQIDVGKDVGLEFWTYEDARGKLYGLAFGGKANKPLWHYSFRNQSDLDKRVQDTIEIRKSHVEHVEQRRQERSQYKHTLKEGDILYSTWGYDQTNVDFYQVVGVGERSVKIREIESRSVDDSHVMPAPNRFKGPPMMKIVGPSGRVKVRSFSWAGKWAGEKVYETPFGYGH